MGADLAWIQDSKKLWLQEIVMDEFIFKVFMDQKEDELKTWSYDLVVPSILLFLWITWKIFFQLKIYLLAKISPLMAI